MSYEVTFEEMEEVAKSLEQNSVSLKAKNIKTKGMVNAASNASTPKARSSSLGGTPQKIVIVITAATATGGFTNLTVALSTPSLPISKETSLQNNFGQKLARSLQPLLQQQQPLEVPLLSLPSRMGP